MIGENSQLNNFNTEKLPGSEIEKDIENGVDNSDENTANLNNFLPWRKKKLNLKMRVKKKY